ncbi:MAG: UbiA family prenyltransferase [Alphaproteobacteria bacterium]|nr:UbiA family prenyltransferase [Alphaproteobacteria bacterium]
MSAQPQIPLVVDLDGTLIKTDLLVEGALRLIRRQPLTIFAMLGWLVSGGKARLKAEVAARVAIDPATLPYQKEFVALLHQRREAGQKLILATAADGAAAKPVAAYIGLFDDVLASDGRVNLDGTRKRRRLVERFGEKGFDYAGNGTADLAVWPSARAGIVVNPMPGVAAGAAKATEVTARLDDRPPAVASHLKALRPQQWLKNLLVFVPLVTSHLVTDPHQILSAILAFIAFGLTASAVYVLNDLLDLPEDRLHPRKRLRVFAAGDVSAVNGIVMLPILLGLAVAVSLPLSPAFLVVLALYLVVTTTYSFVLKRIVLVDVFTLAGLYTLRVIAGSAAIGLWPSFWLLAFSMFIFLSLAMLKRFTELLGLREAGAAAAPGRGYRTDDLGLLAALGGGAGFLSVLVLALYVNSPAVLPLYARPDALWLLCPVLLYWVSRAWLVAHRGDMHDDPVVYAVRDRVSRAVAIVMALIILLAF